MRLFANRRIRDIFILIAQRAVTQDALAKEMKVSTRTIRSDMKALSNIISEFGNSLIHDRKKGFSIRVDNEAGHNTLLEWSQRPWKETRSNAERRRTLLSALLRQSAEISLEELEATWFISIYSLRNDITLLKRHLASYELGIITEGPDKFILSGDEIAVRRCIYDHLLGSKDAEGDYHDVFGSLTSLSRVKRVLTDYFVKQDVVISDVNLRFFTLICAITCERICRGSWLLDYEYAEGEPRLKSVACDILHLLTGDVTVFLQREIDFIAMNLTAFCAASNKVYSEHTQHDVEHAVMNHFLTYISASWCFDVRCNEISRQNLLRHIKAMRLRVNNGITIINPLIEQIKRHYPLMYELTLAAFSEVEHLFFSNMISDDEIGYLVMHIGAILEETQPKDEGKCISALVVNEQGEVSTRMVCQKIVRMYPNIVIAKCISLEQYKAMDHIENDIVISFVDIEEKNKRIISLPPLPERWQLENMKYFLNDETIPPAATVNYFSAEHFFVFDNPNPAKSTVLSFLASQLELKGRVNPQYLASVLEREKRASTLLDDKIAIPHPLGLVALSTMVTVAIFPQGIEWDEGKKVKLVFMLAISEDAFVDSMIIYDYLTNILDNDVIDHLSQCLTFPEFISLSKKYFL